MDPAQFPSWIQAGGVLAFAAAVWFELRKQRQIIEQLSAAVTALLERARLRDEDITPPLGTQQPRGFRRPHTPVRGVDIVNIPRKRTHNDDEES